MEERTFYYENRLYQHPSYVMDFRGVVLSPLETLQRAVTLVLNNPEESESYVSLAESLIKYIGGAEYHTKIVVANFHNRTYFTFFFETEDAENIISQKLSTVRECLSSSLKDKKYEISNSAQSISFVLPINVNMLALKEKFS